MQAHIETLHSKFSASSHLVFLSVDADTRETVKLYLVFTVHELERAFAALQLGHLRALWTMVRRPDDVALDGTIEQECWCNKSSNWNLY